MLVVLVASAVVVVVIVVVVGVVVSVNHPVYCQLLVSFNKYLLFDIFKVVTFHIAVL